MFVNSRNWKKGTEDESTIDEDRIKGRRHELQPLYKQGEQGDNSTAERRNRNS